MSNKVVLITGGSSPIGENLVYSFSKKGYRVVFTYKTGKDKADKIISKLATDNNVMALKLDVTDELQVESVANQVLEAFGRIDVLVNNSGINIDSKIDKMKLEDWKQVLDVNVTGTFLCSKYILPIMEKNKFGRILNIGSVIGSSGCYGASNYAASKAALVGLTKSIALEYARKNITANVVALGYMNVGMAEHLPEKLANKIIDSIPMKSFGDISKVAELIVELASENTEYLTGQVIGINGGLY